MLTLFIFDNILLKSSDANISPARFDLKMGEEVSVELNSKERKDAEITIYSGASHLRNILASILQSQKGKITK